MISFGVALAIWVMVNAWPGAVDPYLYIFLNLILSCLAAIQAPIIMMSQNRSSERDRLKMDQDYLVDLDTELQIERMGQRVESNHQYDIWTAPRNRRYSSPICSSRSTGCCRSHRR